MTSKDAQIDWREILREIRESFTCEDTPRAHEEARYQLERKSFSRMLEDNPDLVPMREDAEEYQNVFDALSHYWRIGAPIPPELIDTILFLYKEVYLKNEGQLSLERTFLNQPGKRIYAKTRGKQDRKSFEKAYMAFGKQFFGKTQTELSEELAKRSGTEPDSIVRAKNRNKP